MHCLRKDADESKYAKLESSKSKFKHDLKPKGKGTLKEKQYWYLKT